MSEQQLQMLKAVELDMFRQFLNVCEKMHLNYYILGGTLLGAVRHKGFIPWDDDIDVGMPRADYELFVAKGQALLDKPYFLQTFETDPGYLANFAKIRNSNTTFVETSLRNCNINHGAYIDIFPLDYYPDEKKDAIWLRLKNRIFMGRISCGFYRKDKLSFKTRFKQAVCKILCPSMEQTLYKREIMFKSFEKGQKIANHCGAWGVKEIVPAEWYAEGCELEFEGLLVKGPKEYDKWLTQVYGNYMQLPPVEKRKGHHYADVIDLDRPYTEYRNKESI